MKPKILEYISTQQVCVVALEMADGSPHAATVHFAHQEFPLLFYFETDKNSRKGQAILSRPVTRASLVLGTIETTKQTLQMDGEMRVITNEENEVYEKTYLGKFPQKTDKTKGPNFLRLVFTPSWWRFTDWATPQGKEITTSTDEMI